MPVKKQDLNKLINETKQVTPKLFDSHLTGKNGKVGLFKSENVNLTHLDVDNKTESRKDRTIKINFDDYIMRNQLFSLDEIPAQYGLKQLNNPTIWTDYGCDLKASVYITAVSIHYDKRDEKFSRVSFHGSAMYVKPNPQNVYEFKTLAPNKYQTLPEGTVAMIEFDEDTSPLHLADNPSNNAYAVIQNYANIFSKNLPAEFIKTLKTVNNSADLVSEYAHIEYEFSALESRFRNFIKDSQYETAYQDSKALFESKKLDKSTVTLLINLNIRTALSGLLIDLKNTQAAGYAGIKPIANNMLNSEQIAAVNADDPYQIIMAGAGTGKTTAVVAKIQRLLTNGVAPNSIMMMSFSNAAVDQFEAKIGIKINHSTYARFIQDIYQENYSHIGTNDITCANTLQLVNTKSPAFANFDPAVIRNLVDNISYNLEQIGSVFTRVDIPLCQSRILQEVLNHFDETVAILNAVNQTTLTLQPIVLYAQILLGKNVNVPAKYQNIKFLFTDEAQDTASFEYTVLLKLTQLRKWNLSIIGDSSQTLYEFRSADPNFLTTLSASKVFKTYAFQTNYRSNQGILTYANQFLDVLKTNQQIGISLHTANAKDIASLSKAVLESQVKPAKMLVSHTNKNYYEDLKIAIRDFSPLEQYIEDCLAKHEQVAVLAYRNKELKVFEDILSKKFPKAKVARLMPDSRRTVNDITKYLNYLNGETFVGTNYQFFALQKLEKYVKTRVKYPSKLLDEWTTWLASDMQIRYMVQANTDYHKIFAYMARIGTIMESKYNSVKYILRKDNAQNLNKLENADILLSTIHSAKGLEFPNTVVYYDENKTAATQETLRLFYVALTRAMKSEMVLTGLDAMRVTSVSSAKWEMLHAPTRAAWLRAVEEVKKTKRP